MGISTIFEEVEDNVAELLQNLKDKQISSLLSGIEWPRVNASYLVEYPPFFPPSEWFDEDGKPDIPENQDWKKSIYDMILESLSSESSDTSAHLECRSKGSSKFWKVEACGETSTVTYGKIGSAGTTNSKDHDSEEDCEKWVQAQIKSKLRDGYKRVGEDKSKVVKKLIEQIKGSKTEDTSNNNNQNNNQNKSSKISVKKLTRTEVGKLKKDELTSLLAQCGIDPSGLKTVALMKTKLSEFMSKLPDEDEMEEEEEKTEEKKELKRKASDENEQSAKKVKTEAVPQTGASKTTIDEIPESVLPSIFQFLPCLDMAKCESVCKKWKSILESDSVWESKFKSQWPQIHPKKMAALVSKAEKKADPTHTWKHFVLNQTWRDLITERARCVYVDKTGEALDYMIARINKKDNPKDAYPTFPLDKLLKPQHIGEDVCYGPIYFFDSKAAKTLWELVKNIDADQIRENWKPETKGFPTVLGGIDCSSGNDQDRDYVAYHFVGFKMFLKGTVERGHGFIRHFWFNLMTFNVWGKFNWPHREKPLESFFTRHMPDVLLLQEVSPDILQLIDKSLTSHSRVKDEKLEGWSCEGNIYWNQHYFDLIEYGAELFKEIKPNTSSPHRRLFWAKLQLIGTSKTIVVATAHLTYQQDVLELETAHNPRIEQSQRIAKFLNERFPSEPIFFAGDLNDPIHPSLVFGKAGYTDPFDDLSLAKLPTYPYGISTEDEPEQVLDFIFAKKVSNVRAIAAHVVKYVYKDFKVGEWPTCSDHYPLQAVYELL